MNGNTEIGEIRGIANNQNMEPEMMPILEEKLKEFPDRDKYLKKEHDMKLLTLIDEKVSKSEELSLDELNFLYEVNGKIDGFGYRKDPRIEEIKNKRNQKKDCYNVKEDEVALSQEEWELNPGQYKALFDDLYLRYETDISNLCLPKFILGYLDLRSLTSTEGLELPQIVGGYLNLSSLTNAEGLVLPQTIGGSLNLMGLISAEGLVFPQTIGGYLNLYSLKSVKGLVLPQNIGGYLDLSSLTSAKGLVLPQTIGGVLNLRSLTNAEGLVLPQNIGGNLDLRYLRSAEGLVLPQAIGGIVYLNYLQSVEGLKLPYGFDLDKLICPQWVKEEILSNPYEYYMDYPDAVEKKSVRR